MLPVDHESKNRPNATVDFVHHEADPWNAWLGVATCRPVIDSQRHQPRVGPGLGQRLRVRGDELRLDIVDPKTKTLLLIVGRDTSEMNFRHAISACSRLWQLRRQLRPKGVQFLLRGAGSNGASRGLHEHQLRLRIHEH
jgi:hypothetical protein